MLRFCNFFFIPLFITGRLLTFFLAEKKIRAFVRELWFFFPQFTQVKIKKILQIYAWYDAINFILKTLFGFFILLEVTVHSLKLKVHCRILNEKNYWMMFPAFLRSSEATPGSQMKPVSPGEERGEGMKLLDYRLIAVLTRAHLHCPACRCSVIASSHSFFELCVLLIVHILLTIMKKIIEKKLLTLYTLLWKNFQ